MPLFIFLFAFSIPAFSNEVTLEHVIASTEKNLPIIEIAKLKVKEAQAENQNTLGSFDTYLSGQVDHRSQGYYDGEYNSIKLVKPIQALNSEIYTGYLNSSGSFPSYQGKLETLSAGEYSIGMNLSLWQNRTIDKKRLNLWNSQLKIQNAKSKKLQVQLKAISEASKVYWKWYATGRVLQVRKELLDIAQKRQQALERRYKKNDIAKIYLTENKQYIVKRKSEYLKAEQEFIKYSNDLSIFYRDKKGTPIVLGLNTIPQKVKNLEKINISSELDKFEKMKMNIPAIRILYQNIKIQENKLKYGKNLNSPKVDLNLDYSQDNGLGPETLEQRELRTGIQISIPLETNQGSGIQKLAKAKIRATKKEIQYLENLTQAQLMTIIQNINTNVSIIENSEQEVIYANELQRAEQIKFKKGASDFFVVNLREKNTGDAKINKILAYSKGQILLAELVYLQSSLLESSG